MEKSHLHWKSELPSIFISLFLLLGIGMGNMFTIPKEPLYIGFLPLQQWITLSLSYTLRSKFLKNYYEIHCQIDGEMHERLDLPVPKSIGMSDEIAELSIGRNFYGLIHSFLLSRGEVVAWY